MRRSRSRWLKDQEMWVAGGELMSSPGVETARKTVVVSVLAGYVLEDVVEEV